MQKRSWLNGYVLFLLLVVVMGIACSVTGRLPVNGGFGYDGLMYGTWVLDWKAQLFTGKIDSTYIQRILPATLAHFSLKALGAKLNNSTVVSAFLTLNFLFIAGGAALIWNATK